MKTPAPPISKERLRERFRAARLALSPDEAAAHSAAICERLAALPEVRAARVVHVYWPLLDRREVDTRPLIRRLAASGTCVVLPTVAAFDGTPTLGHVAFESEDRMRPNRWGIPEPYDTAAVNPAELDAVIVPAFGAGRDGHRIGHGRGYYDAFLAAVDAPAIGAVYATCLVDAVPAESHDVALDVIVTEREAWRPALPRR
ncbi:MAG: 5-formyltetrahydrofolate cyclo-ligase [Rhodothermales bacterium]